MAVSEGERTAQARREYCGGPSSPLHEVSVAKDHAAAGSATVQPTAATITRSGCRTFSHTWIYISFSLLIAVHLHTYGYLQARGLMNDSTSEHYRPTVS
jgi:hypothetical protein